jgi:2-polyprenyl-3-methyl-5-hydroxy-6-metoxy-1,4-benzoquinol methylase
MDGSKVPSLPPLPQEVFAGRIPPIRLDRLTHRACPVCGADRAQPLCARPDRLVVARCADCGMSYLAEIPDERDLADFYRDYGSFKHLSSDRLSWLFRLSPIKPAEPHIEILRASGGLRGLRLCEVGCARGAFLRRARMEGAEVVGVELDDASVRALRESGIAVEPELAGEARFDVVCAFHLIEHLTRPAEFVAQVARALVPGGRLLLALPNGGDGERVGPNWVGYRVDLEHLNYFTIATLARLLGAHGLHVEQYWEVQQPNLARATDAPRSGLVGRAQDWLGNLTAPSWHRSGQFNLVALARKTPPAAEGG